jgi:hypothetical protein
MDRDGGEERVRRDRQHRIGGLDVLEPIADECEPLGELDRQPAPDLMLDRREVIGGTAVLGCERVGVPDADEPAQPAPALQGQQVTLRSDGLTRSPTPSGSSSVDAYRRVSPSQPEYSAYRSMCTPGKWLIS